MSSIEILPPVPIVATVSNTLTACLFSNTGTPAITGLTNSLTPFTFSLSTVDTSTVVSDDTITWHYGDGETGTGNNCTHIYNWPGEYTVQVTFIDSTGNPKRSSLTQKIKVYNYFNDIVWWYTPGRNNCFIDPIFAGKPSDAFTIYRTGSWQSYEKHKDTGYTVNLYVSGSDSKPLTQETYASSKYIHFQRTWRYVASEDSTIPLQSVPTTTNKVYLKKAGDHFEETTADDPTGVFVGTTGEATVHYVDDSPTNLGGRHVPVFLYASLDMSQHGDVYSTTQAINNGYYRDTGTDYFEHHRSVLPVKVLYNAPTKLLYTSNGIPEFGLSYNKLEGTSIPVTVSLADDENNIIIGDFPQLSADLDGFDQYYVSSSLVFTDPTGKSEPPKVKTWRNPQVPIETPGSFSGALSTCEDVGCTDTVKLTGHVTITDPAHSNFPEITNIYVADVRSNELFNYRIQYRFPDSYSYLHNMTLSYSLPQLRQTERNITTPGLSSILGIAINGTGEAWVADGDVDRIMRIDACGQTTYTVPVSTYIPGSDNTSPVGIAVDGNSDFYFTCADTVSAFKVKGNAPIRNVPPPLLATMKPDVPNRVFRGNNTVQPGPIETTMDNKVFVGYTHPLSTFLCLYDNNGEFIDRYPLPAASNPVDILCDRQQTTWVLGAGPGKETGTLTHLDRNGTTIHTMSGINMPGALAMDDHGDVWFSYGANRVRKVSGRTHRIMYDTGLGTRLDPPYDYISAIEGMASDLDGNILVIQNFDKKLYFIDSDDPFTFNTVNIPSKHPDNRVQAYGDWTGGRWINKYGRATSIAARNRTIVGESDSFRILPVDHCNTIAKLNEDHDHGAAIVSYMTQPAVRDAELFQTSIITKAVGDYYSYPWEFGKVIYEKISNFVSNVSDVHTSNIKNVYSMAGSVGYRLDDYNYTYPSELGRIMDLVSIKHKKLFGDRDKFDLDFDDFGSPGSDLYAKNLGRAIDTKTYIVTAGVPIVANELYGNVKSKISPLVVDGDANSAGYSTKYKGLTSYPLSAYDDAWGWGLSYETNMLRYYSFYEYIPGYKNTHIEKIIDWDNWYTTLLESNTGYSEWVVDRDNIVEQLIDVSLKKGLSLINSCAAGSPPACVSNLSAHKGVNLEWDHSIEDRRNTSYYRIQRSSDGVNYTTVGTVKKFAKSTTDKITHHDSPPQCMTSWYRVEAVNDFGHMPCSGTNIVDIYSDDYKSVDIKFYAGPPTPTPTPYPVVTPTPRPTGTTVRWRQPRAAYIKETKKGYLYLERPGNSDDQYDIFVDVGLEYLDTDKAAAVDTDVHDITSGIYRIPAGVKSIRVPVQAYGDYELDEQTEVYLVKILDAYTDYNVSVTIQGYDFAAVSIIPGPGSVPLPTPTPTDYYEQFQLAITPTPTDYYEQFYLAITPTPTGRGEEFILCSPTPTPTGQAEQIEMCVPTPTPTPTPTYGTPCDVNTDTEESEIL